MKRAFKTLVFLFLAVVALVVVAGGVILLVVDDEMLTERAEAAAEEVLGRDVWFEEPVNVSLWPYLGLRTGAVRVAGGSPDSRPLLMLDSARIRLRLEPLLQGRLVFKEIRLRGAELVFVKDAHWRGPLERVLAILDEGGQDPVLGAEPPTQPPWGLADLGRCVLSEARIVWRGPGGETWTIENGELILDAKAVQPLALSGDLAGELPAGPLSATFQLRGKMSFEQEILRFQDGRLEAEARWPRAGSNDGAPRRVRVASAVAYDGGEDSLRLEDGSLEAGPAELAFGLRAMDLEDEPRLEGELAGRVATSTELIAWLGAEAPSVQGLAAPAAISSARWSWSAGVLAAEAVLTLSDQQVAIAGGYDPAAGVEATVSTPRFDLDAFLSPTNAEDGQGPASSSLALPETPLALVLDAGELLWRGETLRDVHLETSSREGVIEVDHVQAAVRDSSVSAHGEFDTTSQPPAGRVSVAAAMPESEGSVIAAGVDFQLTEAGVYGSVEIEPAVPARACRLLQVEVPVLLTACGPISLSTRFDYSGGALKLNGMAARTGPAELAGSLTVTMAATPRVSFDLSLNRFDSAWLDEFAAESTAAGEGGIGDVPLSGRLRVGEVLVAGPRASISASGVELEIDHGGGPTSATLSAASFLGGSLAGELSGGAGPNAGARLELTAEALSVAETLAPFSSRRDTGNFDLSLTAEAANLAELATMADVSRAEAAATIWNASVLMGEERVPITNSRLRVELVRTAASVFEVNATGRASRGEEEADDDRGPDGLRIGAQASGSLELDPDHRPLAANLEVSAEVENVTLEQQDPLTLSTGLDWSGASRLLRLGETVVLGPGVEIRGHGELSGLGDEEGLSWTATLDPFSVDVRQALYKFADFVIRPTRDPSVFGKGIIRTTLAGDETGFTADDLFVSFDGTEARGRAWMDDFSEPTLELDMEGNFFSYDRYRAPETYAEVHPGPAVYELEALRLPRVRGDVRVEEVTAYSFTFSNVVGKAHIEDGVYDFPSATADFAGGELDASLVMRAGLAELWLDCEATGRDFDLAGVIEAQFERDYIRGTTDADMAFTMHGPTSDSLLETMDGTMSVRLGKGSMKLTGWEEYERQLAEAAEKKADRERKGFRAREKTEVEEKRTVFNEGSATATVSDGVVTNDDLLLKSNAMETKGRGTIDLAANTIDYKLVMSFLNMGRIPLEFTGSLDDVQVKVNAMEAMGGSAGEMLKGVIEIPLKSLFMIRDLFPRGDKDEEAKEEPNGTGRED
jgi:AsmA protein